jgi:hypothetical protein
VLWRTALYTRHSMLTGTARWLLLKGTHAEQLQNSPQQSDICKQTLLRWEVLQNHWQKSQEAHLIRLSKNFFLQVICTWWDVPDNVIITKLLQFIVLFWLEITLKWFSNFDRSATGNGPLRKQVDFASINKASQWSGRWCLQPYLPYSSVPTVQGSTNTQKLKTCLKREVLGLGI